MILFFLNGTFAPLDAVALYGQGKRQIEWCSGTALWYRGGQTPLPVRWVLSRDPKGEHDARAYFSIAASAIRS